MSEGWGRTLGQVWAVSLFSLVLEYFRNIDGLLYLTSAYCLGMILSRLVSEVFSEQSKKTK